VNADSTTRTIRPARNIQGTLRLPGDKSISHRYAMLAAFAHGNSTLHNFSTGQDCASTLRCMAQLGADVVREGDGTVTITGTAGSFTSLSGPLDCGNSGSTMRMLSGLLAAQSGSFVLSGVESLSRRPMQRVATPLQQMGAHLTLTDGHAPLTITGSALQSIRYAMPVASAQVKSAILFAGLQASGETTVEEAVRTRDHSELALRAFGAELQRTRTAITIPGGQQLQAVEATVPGDLSSAAFFLCAAGLLPGSSLTVEGLGMNPTRAGLLDVLAALGLRIQVLALEEANHELTGTVHVEAPLGGLKGADISGGVAAQLMDELPMLAALGPLTQNGVKIRDAKELRVKESDRIALVAQNLRAMGAEVVEHEDGLDVPGGQKLRGAEIRPGGDHRIAMAFAVAALAAEGETLIHDPGCASVSFPEFFELLNRVTMR
jgi:3-phosphoshikimate 1-carboxyvinyltransferase